MQIKNLFDQKKVNETLQRIEQLTADTQPNWGKMSVGQMLAHCNVAYEMVYTDKHEKPGAVARFFLKLFVKNSVVGLKPYAKNSRTAPAFLITEEKDFETEKKRLVDYINQTLKLGGNHFDGKASHSFGNLSKTEWNTLFSKHLDHHLRQFGV